LLCHGRIFPRDALEASLRRALKLRARDLLLAIHRQTGGDPQRRLREAFGSITMRYVIQHAHHPTKILEKDCELLNPGGAVGLETMNFETGGQARFGAFLSGLAVTLPLIFSALYAGIKAIFRSPHREFLIFTAKKL
jgi:2-polyprenyl-3-methyl-5-hydroxy-6-metoxy-1,4-benzoquinol methylase